MRTKILREKDGWKLRDVDLNRMFHHTKQATNIVTRQTNIEALQFTNHTECQCMRRITAASPQTGANGAAAAFHDDHPELSVPRPVWPANCTCVQHFDVMNVSTTTTTAEEQQQHSQHRSTNIADVSSTDVSEGIEPDAADVVSPVFDTMCWCGCRTGNSECEALSSGRLRFRVQDRR